jgi:signal transduction histidine kinase
VPSNASRRIRSTPWQPPDFDFLLAALAFVALLVDPVVAGHARDLTPLAGVLAFLASAPLLARRRTPLGVLLVVAPILLACLVVFHPDKAAVAVVMLVVFSVGERGDRGRSFVVGVFMAPVVMTAVVVTAQHGTVSDVIGYAALVLGALVAGDATRARHALLQARNDEVQRERVATAQHRFDEERLRVAHELHDVIGHALVAINVRASAAAHLERHRDAKRGDSALDEIAAASAEALSELRSTLKEFWGVSSDAAPLHPPQTLENLPNLVAGVEKAGLTVSLDMTDLPEPLPSGIAHAGYRIVQEGLTNVLRHSTASNASVRIASDKEVIILEVVDDGHARRPTSGTAGRGLLGMAERAHALGGECWAGPVGGGGWHVRTQLPLDRTSAS